jgi:hypothetical protein
MGPEDADAGNDEEENQSDQRNLSVLGHGIKPSPFLRLAAQRLLVIKSGTAPRQSGLAAGG